MSLDLKLRKIRPRAVPLALEKARQYRLLKEPEQAESICLDVLACDPTNVDAIRTLVLALTDQFITKQAATKSARAKVAELPAEYDRVYYSGLISEREARAHLARSVGAAFAHDLFIEAIELYSRAEALAPDQNDDAILRRNSCLRTMAAEGLEPMAETSELPLE
jgi:tetratricopeptide (TPR) repeat protein